MNPATSNPSRSRRWSWMRTAKSARSFRATRSDLVDGETEMFTANGKLADAKFWSDGNPYLYDVYSILTVNDKVVDVQKIHTGFRKAEFKGGVGTGGVYLNDQFVWLDRLRATFGGRLGRTWARRIPTGCTTSTRIWSAARTQITSAGCTFRRRPWTCAPATKPASWKSVRRATRRRTLQGRQWEQRVEVMRDSMIYFRNDPSILFWEAGNNSITTAALAANARFAEAI